MESIDKSGAFYAEPAGKEVCHVTLHCLYMQEVPATSLQSKHNTEKL